MSLRIKVDEDALDRLRFNAAAKVAVLIRLSEAAQGANTWDGDAPFDRLFWRGIEQMSRDVLDDIEAVQKARDREAEYVPIEREKGGAS